MTRMVGGLAAISDMLNGERRAQIAHKATRDFAGDAFVAPHAWLVNEPFPGPGDSTLGPFLVFPAAGVLRAGRLAGGTLVGSAMERADPPRLLHLRGAA